MATPNVTPISNIPIAWPRVSIGPQNLEVKWTLLADCLLSQWGIDQQEALNIAGSLKKVQDEQLDEAGNVIKAAQWAADPHYTARMLDMFAACVGHNYTALKMEPPRGIEWAEKIADEEWPLVCAAVYTALGKRVADRKKPQPSAPVVVGLDATTVQ